jgi:helix-turn-helix protein
MCGGLRGLSVAWTNCSVGSNSKLVSFGDGDGLRPDRRGISRQTINEIETEKYDPSLPLAFKAARLFKVRIEEIFQDDR